MNLHAIIVEDEQASLDNLKNILTKYCPNVTIVAEARNIKQA